MIRALLLTTMVWGAPALAQDAPAPAPPPTVSEADALAPLEAAYQKEYAYLLAERDGLDKRIAAQKAEADQARAKAAATLDQLEARLTALQVRVENAEDQLADVERAASSASEAEDGLAASWFQARTTLSSDGVELDDTSTGGLPGYAEGFRRAFDAASDRVALGRQVRLDTGAWFGHDGAEVQGDLVRVGNIATFGRTAGASVALLPAGEGRLQAWREGGGATGDVLAQGGQGPTMGLFLHEGRTKRIDEREPKTWADIFEAGGVVGYVILGLGALAGVLIVLRMLTLWTAGRGDGKVEAALAALESGRADEARSLLASARGAAANVVGRMLPHLEQRRETLEDLANEALLREAPRIERFGSAILVAAAVAPLLGLLGTVTGMIATFDIITEFGTGDPRMLSGGISAALVTTQFGLIVAIPALLIGNLLGGWGDTLMSRAENAALRVLNAVDHVDGGHDTPDALKRVS
ncbi:MAG: MotA/TolQ/ExbB proton channel family protein [Alphaproteobacteria bacterium]|nr:MotA/TolQ/ExbB proton channel family protein [Alphaproteobacteria bacterium]